MEELIKIHQQDNQQVVSAKELYDFLELEKTHWKRWYEKNITNNRFAFENLDFGVFALEAKTNEGRPTIDFWLTIDFAKRLSMVVRNEKGEEIRRYFIRCEEKLNDIKQQRDDFELLTIEQVYFLIDLINVFSFITHQKAIEKAHLDFFIDKNGKILGDKIYAQFHIYRNKALDIEPETIKERILRYYDEENKLIDKTRKRDILAIIDKYSLVGNAAFDFMASIGKSTEVSLKVSKIVKDMADRMNAEIRTKNEPDLFHDEIKELNPVIIKQVNPHLENPKLKNKK